MGVEQFDGSAKIHEEDFVVVNLEQWKSVNLGWSIVDIL